MEPLHGSLGIVGLGLVGRALGGRALDAGLTVSGHDPSAAATEAAAALGIGTVPSLGALVGRCPVLLVCVFDDGQFAAVVDAVCAARSGDSVPTELLINTATCGPATIDGAAARLADCGIEFVEAPLSGSSAQIGDGSALALVAGKPAAIERWQSWLDRLFPNRVVVGTAGAGARTKLASNLILGLNRAALAEGLALAEAMGLDGHDFLDVLRRSAAYSRAVDTAGKRMVERDFRPQSRLAQHRKDLALILDQGTAVGQPMPLTEAHAALLDRAIALGLGDSDNGAVFAVLRHDR